MAPCWWSKTNRHRRADLLNLRHAGFEVTLAATADQAQAAVDAVLPDLVLLDWMLPGQSGPGAGPRWRADARTRELPVIMLTARARRPTRSVQAWTPAPTTT
jgi:DNA-binding response OmpR family regulator